MAIEAVITESLEDVITFEVSGNEDKKINQSLLNYRRTAGQTDEEAEADLIAKLEADSAPW